MRPILCLFASLALFAGVALPAQAETYHTCGTVIASLPTVISTQGVYCLNKDLSTSITSGKAIDVEANNVTIDCNGYKIGGLAGGTSSIAVGVYADYTHLNITVRNCGIRGYYQGINLSGGVGNLVEDNRLDNNLYVGINAQGEHNMLRRNRIFDTGGFPGGLSAYGIVASGEIDDNTVSGVFADGSGGTVVGIAIQGTSVLARGNMISGLAVGTGTGMGLQVQATAVALRGNTISASATTNGTGILGNSATDTICSDNLVFRFVIPIDNCQNGGGNVSN